MEFRYKTVTLISWLVCLTATAQTTIFNENFDGGYTGSFATASYSGGSPTGCTNYVMASGGHPKRAWRETMTPTNGSDYYTGQVQLRTVSGNTDTNPSNYVLSFDAYGSQAANIQFMVQTWQYSNFGGAMLMNVTVNDPLAAANTWQTFSVNLGSIAGASPVGATWQLNFQLNAGQWGGAGITNTLTIDNIILTHVVNPIQLTSSLNPSPSGGGVTFTATVQTNGITAGNATGQVVFSTANGPFSTNTVSGGSASSSSITNLPMGTDLVTASYSGGNYSSSINTLFQLVILAPGIAQDNLPIYIDSLKNGFKNWSWGGATVNTQDSSQAHFGSYSISAVVSPGNSGFYLGHAAFNNSPYTSLNFWINGGGTGGQKVRVWGTPYYINQPYYSLVAPTNTWQQFTIPLSTLGASSQANCTGFYFTANTAAAQPAFYVDDVQLVAAPVPTLVHLGVDATTNLQPVDARQFGVNTWIYDTLLTNSQTLSLLTNMGCLSLRWPGGSVSDQYHWANYMTNSGLNGSPTIGNITFGKIATNMGAKVFITANYGTGTPGEAAAWVRSANQTNHFGFKYWEIGNECYGNWETDTHAVPWDPYTYATNAVAYMNQMRAADPTIKVGVVVAPGEGSYVNNSNHYAINPRTVTTNYGWTPIVLSTLKSLAVTPDFLIDHFYPQSSPIYWGAASNSPDSDPLLLQVAGNPCPATWTDWASAAANLRQQISDYIGSAGTNIELCVTENNSDAGSQGRQSTSLVNGLYLADSTCQLMKTEFKAHIWFVLHSTFSDPNSAQGDFDPTVYGWRTNGDIGMQSSNPDSSLYPTYYAEKLLQYFARPGDAVLNATSDNILLSAYAVHRTNGTLTMLVINKDMTTSLNAQITLTNFVPWSSATIQAYGIPQDQAAKTTAIASLQDVATTNISNASTNFTNAFPPLSLTLFTFAPGPSVFSVLGLQSGQVIFQLQGQPGTPYIIQKSTDLKTWTPVSTNMLVGNTLSLTNLVSPGAPIQFWRSLWQP